MGFIDMTPEQQTVLGLIKKLNDAEFSGWFLPSEVMAFCQVESSFRPKACRYEPRLNEGSYGLMQVLASTAAGVGLTGSPEQMYDPETGLRIGMKVAQLYWQQLSKYLRRDPTKEEWCDSYNRGVGGVEHIIDSGSTPDDAYIKVWTAAQKYWVAQGVDGAST
jgi:hypothetical protein